MDPARRRGAEGSLWGLWSARGDRTHSAQSELAISKQLELAWAATSGTGDWRAIPSLLHTLAHDSASLRNTGAAVIAELALLIPAGALPGFEGRVRAATVEAYSWNELTLARILRTQWPPLVWAMYSMHPTGYVREEAVRQLVRSGQPARVLPYLLLRLNDWVEQVRAQATAAVRRLLVLEHVVHWIPVLGLVDQLRSRSRAGHAWLADAVTTLFLQAEARRHLLHAAKSADRAVARWAIRTSLTLSEADRAIFVRLALESGDPVVRLRGARAVRTWPQCPERDRLLAMMASDRFMPIRREALYATIEGDPDQRRSALHAALLDRHGSMRHAAKFYLRENSPRDGEGLDLRTFYLGVLAGGEPSTRAVAILGAGECGAPSDADQLDRFVADRSSRVASAAVRAVATLNRDGRADWFLRSLVDPRASVARAAARALETMGSAAPVDGLRQVLRDAPFPHSRRFALRILLRRHPYDAVVDAIFAAGSEDASLEREGADFIQRAMPWTVRGGPTPEQSAAAQREIQALRVPLPENLDRRLRDFLGLGDG